MSEANFNVSVKPPLGTMFAWLIRKTRPKTPHTQPKTCPPPNVYACSVRITVRISFAPRFQALLRGGIRDAWMVSNVGQALAMNAPNPNVIACMKILSRRYEQLELHHFINAVIGRFLITKEIFKTVIMVVDCTWFISGYPGIQRTTISTMVPTSVHSGELSALLS